MRIAAFDRKDGAGLGVIAGEELIDLTAVDASAPRELGAALRAPGGLKALEAIAARAGAGAAASAAVLCLAWKEIRWPRSQQAWSRNCASRPAQV